MTKLLMVLPRAEVSHPLFKDDSVSELCEMLQKNLTDVEQYYMNLNDQSKVDENLFRYDEPDIRYATSMNYNPAFYNKDMQHRAMIRSAYNVEGLYKTYTAMILTRLADELLGGETILRNDFRTIMSRLLPFIGQEVAGITIINSSKSSINYYNTRIPVNPNCTPRGWYYKYVIQITNKMYVSQVRKALQVDGHFGLIIDTKEGLENDGVMTDVVFEKNDNIICKIGCAVFNGSPTLMISASTVTPGQVSVRFVAPSAVYTDYPKFTDMLVDKTGPFEFTAATDENNVIRSLAVNDVSYDLTPVGLVMLKENGIDVTSSGYASLGGKKFHVKKLETDTIFKIVPVPVAPSLMMSKLFSLVLDTDDSRVPTIRNFQSRDDMTEFTLQFGFSAHVDIHYGHMVVTALPIYEYYKSPWNNADIETFPVTYKASIVPMGFSTNICTVDVVVNHPRPVSSFLIRVEFKTGALIGNNSSTLSYVNDNFVTQFEISSADVLTSSSSAGTIASLSADCKYIWVPRIPATILKSSLKLSGDDNNIYYVLVYSEKNIYLLSKSLQYDGDIPTPWTPESSTYKPYTDIPSNAKFAVLSIPIMMMGEYENGKVINVRGIEIQSKTPVAFNIAESYNIYPIANHNTDSDDNGGYGVSYINVRRLYVNGHIDIPVMFINNDTIKIIVRTDTAEMDFIINVDLLESEDDTSDGDSDIDSPTEDSTPSNDANSEAGSNGDNNSSEDDGHSTTDNPEDKSEESSSAGSSENGTSEPSDKLPGSDEKTDETQTSTTPEQNNQETNKEQTDAEVKEEASSDDLS